MLNILTKFVSILTTDPTLNAIVPATNIFTGPVDVTEEQRNTLLFPQIDLKVISESVRTVPRNAKDTRIQIDIWSRKSELEAETIYERILVLLNFVETNSGGTHIFWQRLSSASSEYISEVRMWRISQDFVVWSLD